MKMLAAITGMLLVLGALAPKSGKAAMSEGHRWVAASMTCPADTPRARSAVIKFLKSPGFAADRTDLGLTVADTANLRVLVASTDSAACQRFLQQVTVPPDRPQDWAYYRAGAFYFVPIVPRCDPCLRHGSLAVFDTTFMVKKTLGI